MAEVVEFEVSPRIARAPVERMVFVCRKCAKKFPDRKFRKRLREAAKSRAWGRVRIMETGCFDLCPKRRQVVASAGLVAAGRLMVVQAGTTAETVMRALFGEPGLSRRGSVFEAPDDQQGDPPETKP